MIIAISGPSSTGKTTLFNKLKNEHKDFIESVYHNGKVVFHEESIRKIIENEYSIPFEEIIKNPETAVKLQLRIADEMYESTKMMLSDFTTLYICDRCPLDNIVYNIMNYQSDNPDFMIKHAEDLSHACSIMRSMYHYIDRIYLTSVDRDSTIVRDGFRPTGYEHRRQLEIELFNTIFDFSNKVLKLPSTMNERITTILSDLSEKLERPGIGFFD